jgi:hypothetical protein
VDIKNPTDARAFLSEWGPKIRRGILGAVIDGCMSAFRLMRANPVAYGTDAALDMREAVSVLKLAFRERFGVEYTNHKKKT